MFKGILLAVIPIAFIPSSVRAQVDNPVLGQRAGFAEVAREHVRWPPPETVANDLRSGNSETRIKALKLMGFTEEQIHRPVWSQGNDASTSGTRVVKADAITLTYAALAESETQQAILAVYIQDLQVAQLAVAVPVAGGWKRIAVVSCWCKYEEGTGVNSFTELQRAPGSSPDSSQLFELVVRASSGGTGLYEQTEAHFRVLHGDLREVFSFTSRRRECDGGTRGAKFPCSLDRRWFYPTESPEGHGGALVCAHGDYTDQGFPPAWWTIRDLEIKTLGPIQCTSFLWDEKGFHYKQVGTATNPCSSVIREPVSATSQM